MPEPKPPETPPPAEAPAAPGQRLDPYRAYLFKMVIDGLNEAHFTQCTGLGVKVHPIRYREGGEARIVHQLSGPVEYAEITLRYGLFQSPEIWAWLMSAVQGTPQRKHVSIVMLGPGGIGDGVRWDLMEAWPCAWRGAPLDALGREVAIESLTLVYESIART